MLVDSYSTSRINDITGQVASARAIPKFLTDSLEATDHSCPCATTVIVTTTTSVYEKLRWAFQLTTFLNVPHKEDGQVDGFYYITRQ